MTQPARSGDEFSKETFSEEALTYPEKFELLSVYLDDEATEEEQRLVKHWLSSDLNLQQQYREQLKLRIALRATLSKPSPNQVSTNIANASSLSSRASSKPTKQTLKEPSPKELPPKEPSPKESPPKESQSLQSLGATPELTTVAADSSLLSVGASIRLYPSPPSPQRVLGL